MEEQLIHDIKRGRFFIQTDAGKATLKYKRGKDGSSIKIKKTKVPFHYRGKGIGKILVNAAIKFATSQNLTILFSCSFADRVQKILS